MLRRRSDLNMPGWSVHPLKGNREGRPAKAVGGPWRITFRSDGKDAHELALEQPVTPEMAVRLGKWAGNGPALWLGMQQAFDVWHAE